MVDTVGTQCGYVIEIVVQSDRDCLCTARRDARVGARIRELGDPNRLHIQVHALRAEQSRFTRLQ